MNKVLLTVSLATVMVIAASCSGDKSGKQANDIVSVNNNQQEVVLNDKLQKSVGSWIEKGMECYGIVIATPSAEGQAMGKSVKCKVMAIKPDMIKLKTLESVSLMESKGCDRLGLSYGDTWWEAEGDIFRTKAEADAYLAEKGWLIK